jgi:uncharacterized protein YciI
MMFVVIAQYATDEGMAARRARVRDAHVENLKVGAERGEVIISGPILDDEGNPKGSALIVEVASREALMAFLEADLYRLEGVWESFEIHPFQRVV